MGGQTNPSFFQFRLLLDLVLQYKFLSCVFKGWHDYSCFVIHGPLGCSRHPLSVVDPKSRCGFRPWWWWYSHITWAGGGVVLKKRFSQRPGQLFDKLLQFLASFALLSLLAPRLLQQAVFTFEFLDIPVTFSEKHVFLRPASTGTAFIQSFVECTFDDRVWRRRPTHFSNPNANSKDKTTEKYSNDWQTFDGYYYFDQFPNHYWTTFTFYCVLF